MSRRLTAAKINGKALAVLLLVLLSLGAALVGAHYIRKRNLANRALADGRAAIERSDWPEAARLLRRYLGKYPDDPIILREYGQACLLVQPRAREDLLAATGAYRSLLRIEKQDSDAFEILAKLYANLGDAANLAQTAERWAAGRPDALKPRLWLARADLMMRDFENAEGRLRAMIQDHADCSDAYVLLAAVETRKGENEASIAAALCWLDQAIEKSSGAANACLHRAQLLARQGFGRDHVAQQRIRAALGSAECAPSVEHQTWLGIAAQWLELGERARSSAALQHAARAWAEREPDDLDDPEDWLASVAIQQIAIFTHAGDVAGGAEAADAALQQLTQPVHRLRLLPEAIRLDVALAECDRAHRRLDELATLHPMQHGSFAEKICLLRSFLATIENRPYAAIAELELLVTRNASMLEAWRLLADAYDQTNQSRRAVAALQECRRLAPQQLEPALALLRRQVRLQDWEAAHATAALVEPLAQGDDEYSGLRLQAEVGVLSRDSSSPDAIERLLGDALAYQGENPTRIESYTIVSSLEALAGRIDLAEAELHRAITVFDNSLPAELELVRLLVKSGQQESAEKAACSAAERHPASAAAAIVLSKVQCATGKFDAARQTLRGAAQRITDPPGRRELFSALVDIADLYDPDSRTGLLREQAAVDPADVPARVMLLELPGMRQDAAQAQHLVDELRRIEGDGGLTWRVQQARLWLTGDGWRERLKNIEVELRRCIEADPGGLEAVLTLGEMYERSGDWPKAEALYRKTLGLNATATEVVSRLVGALERQGSLSDARAVLDQYARDAAELDDQRLRVAVRSGQFDVAIAQLQRRLQQNPGDIESRATLASCTFRRTGDADAALDILGDAQQPDSPSLAQARVRVSILQAAGRDNEARAFLDELITGRGDFAAYALRVQYRMQSGDAQGAEADLRRGVELSPDGEGHLALSRFCLMRNRADDAANALEAGLQKFPSHEAMQRFQVRVCLERKRAGDWERAASQLAQLEKRHPDDLELMWIRSLLEIAEASPDALARAETLLQRVVAIEPRMLDAQLGLTGLALQRHDAEEARRRIERALIAIPDDLMLGLLHARVEMEFDPAAAMDVLRGVLRVHGKDSEARRLFLEAAAQSGVPQRVEEALRAADVWMGEPADSAALQVPRAMLLVRLDRTDEAVAALQLLCAGSSDDVRGPALVALAALHRAGGDFDRARACLEGAAAAGLSGRPLLREQWLLLGERQRFDDVESAIVEHARAQRPDPDLLLLGAKILAGSPTHADRAPQIIERILRLAQSRTDIQLECARLLSGRGQLARAEQLYRALLASEPRNAGVLNNLAWVLLSRKREYPRALDLASRAVVLHPTNATFLDTRGLALEKLGRLAQAHADYERCVALTEPRLAENASARLKLARVCVALKDWDAARVQLTRIGEIDSRASVLDDGQRREFLELAHLSGKVE